MANRYKGDVDIDMLGKTRTLRPTFGALAGIEHATGMGFAAVVQRFASGQFGIDDVAIVLREGMGAAGDDAPDLETIKRAIVDEGFGVCAAAAGAFLGNAVLGDNPVKKPAVKKKT